MLLSHALLPLGHDFAFPCGSVLPENEIEEDAAGEPYFQIGSLLTRCRSLRRLELRRMNIGETALTSLVDGLIQQAEGDESWHLEYLSLAGEFSFRTQSPASRPSLVFCPFANIENIATTFRGFACVSPIQKTPSELVCLSLLWTC